MQETYFMKETHKETFLYERDIVFSALKNEGKYVFRQIKM